MNGQSNGYASNLIAALRGASKSGGMQADNHIAYFDSSNSDSKGQSTFNFQPTSREAAFNPQVFSVPAIQRPPFAGGGQGGETIPGFNFDEYRNLYTKEEPKGFSVFRSLQKNKKPTEYSYADAMAEYVRSKNQPQTFWPASSDFA